MEVLQFRGRTGLYLEHSHGQASLQLLKMAREGLALELRAAVAKAIKQDVRVRQRGVQFEEDGQTVECNIEVVPFSPPPATDRFYLVVFEPCARAGHSPASKSRLKKRSSAESVEGAELARLRQDLTATRESLHDIIGQLEATNDELRSANEDIMSSNEELQSTNEELETAKEELQSTNEELTTLNDELENRNGELEQVNNDLYNLLASVNIPIIMLSPDLRIRRFTNLAERLLNLIPGDVGRPITDINLPFNVPSLDKLVLEVFETLAPIDLELQDPHGHWWSVRIRPFKTTDHKIEGAIIALVDIDLMKANLQKVTSARDIAETIVNNVREPLLVLDKNLDVISANRSFYRMFQVAEKDTVGHRIYQLGNRQWDIPRLRKLLEEILPQRAVFEDFEVKHDFPLIGRKHLMLNARCLSDGSSPLILLAIEEVGGPA
jgi:two-component system CheB/CheR fusion protein